ncbi:MAG: helix-turn-helix domain-containing protein [Thermodesulfobacteriota bacterium]
MNDLDLDQMILDLKAEGKSLRRIAAALVVSHTTVMRRLRAMNQPPGTGVGGGGRCNKSEKRHPARLSGGSENIINQVLQKKAPSHRTDTGVTGLGRSVEHPLQGQLEGIPEVSPEFDLFEGIRRFLENQGIELYRVQVAQEAYQVDRNGQIVRFYVQRRIGVDKAKEEME